MDKKLNKIFARLAVVSGYAVYQFLSIIGQFLISYFVIKYHSEALWGEVVEHLLFVNLATMFFTWGQNTYLVRVMSRDTLGIGVHWQESLLTRSVLLFIVLLMVGIFYWNKPILIIYISLWLIFSYLYHSIDPIHLFIKTFEIPIFIELLSLGSFILLFYWNIHQLSALLIIQFYIVLSFIKTIGLMLFYRATLFKISSWHFNPPFFAAALPFFLPAMIGFVQSRMDLYGVAYYLPEKTLGAYQVFFGILMIFIMGGKILINPFLKVIYRLPFPTLIKLNRLLFLRAAALLIPSFAAIYYILPFVYGIHFEWTIYVAAYCMMTGFFGYVILTHLLIKYHKENQMVLVFAAGAFFNLWGNYLLIPGYGVLGAVGVMALVQWGMLGCFVFLTKHAISDY